MGVDAKVVEDFVAYTRDKKAQDPVEHQFKKGDTVNLSQIWEGELCLIKNPEGKVFNIKKAFLEKEVFEKKAGDEKGKTRRKRSGDIPDFAALSDMRPDLELERGLAPSLAKSVELTFLRNTRRFLRSKTGGGVTVIILILAIYVGWTNFQKSRNDTPSGILARAILEKGRLIKPGHFHPSFHQITLDYDSTRAEARVHDSVWGKRTLTLKLPGKKSSILASDQEDRWLNNSQFHGIYFDEFVDIGSDGQVDEVRKVLEFRSETNILVGAYRKTVYSDAVYEERYKESVRQIVQSLAK